MKYALYLALFTLTFASNSYANIDEEIQAKAELMEEVNLDEDSLIAGLVEISVPEQEECCECPCGVEK